MQAYALALKMFKKKAKPRFRKYKPPFENIQCNIGPVCYLGGKPNYLLHGEKYYNSKYLPFIVVIDGNIIDLRFSPIQIIQTKNHKLNYFLNNFKTLKQ